jgi:hypothetical protein
VVDRSAVSGAGNCYSASGGEVVLQFLKDLIFGIESHECKYCEHVLPSQRANWHRGYRGVYLIVLDSTGV